MKPIILILTVILMSSCRVWYTQGLINGSENVRVYGIIENNKDTTIWQYLTVRLDTKLSWVKEFNDTAKKANISQVVRIKEDKYHNAYIVGK